MARLPRLSIPGHVHQVLQRGHNRQRVFRDDDDRRRFLDLLQSSAQKAGIAVHAYVLLDDHYHLLVTPSTDQALSACMQALGRSYVRYFNDRHHHTGTLWDGRYRAGVLQAERYLLPCMVFLDWHPVRSGLAATPSDYPWSSHHHYVGRAVDRCLSPPPGVWALGNTPFEREARYGALVDDGLPAPLLEELARQAPGGWVLGEPEFVARLQQGSERRLSRGRAGRPSRGH